MRLARWCLSSGGILRFSPISGSRLVSLALGALLFAPRAFAVEPATASCLEASERGEALRRDGRYRAARTTLAGCVPESCPAIVRRDCSVALADIERVEPTFVFVARDDAGNDLREVVVSVDGEVVTEHLDGRPLGLDAGDHVLAFHAGPRYRPQRLTLVAHAAEKNRLLTIRFAAEPGSERATPASPAGAPAAPERPATTSPPFVPLVLATVGVVAVGAFAFVGLSAKSDLGDLESAPCAASRTCSEADVDSVQSRFLLADVALGTGIVALGAAAILWFVRGR